ncbi:hypothetical protein [Klebsiella pneumoniae]|uniref:hypothetical protein n=1 Tax=Klebsiella pneumoniae TaxID=573 RepID=UPI000D649726|nr:hypothetical protein [Klebsiella pneumoniae]
MKQQKFEATLKKSVAMFNMLTGRDLTEREGSAFIHIFDLVDDYTGAGSDAVQAFDVLSQAAPKPGLRETPAAKDLQKLDLPVFTDPRPQTTQELYEAVADCGCPEGRCTCTDQMLANVPSRAAKVVVESTPASVSPWLDARPKGVKQDSAMAAAAKQYGIRPKVLEQLAKAESSDNKQPIGGIVETAAGVFSAEPEKQAEIDAAWQSRDEEHVQERSRIEQERVARAASEKAARYVETTDRHKHPVGYDWQVCALCREGARDNSFVRCYKSEPTPEEFFELYRLYDAHSHWVFINRWNAGAQRWDKFLEEYLEQHAQAIRNLRGTIPPRVIKVSKDPEELKGRDVSMPPMSDPWEEADKPWRIRYYSDVMQRVIFTYIDKKPTGAEMAHFHHTKCLAVSQARPKQ